MSEKQFDVLLGVFTAMDTKFGSRLDAIDIKFETRFTAMDARFDSIENRLDNIETELKKIKHATQYEANHDIIAKLPYSRR